MNIIFINSQNVINFLIVLYNNNWKIDLSAIDLRSKEIGEELPRYTHKIILDFKTVVATAVYDFIDSDNFICYENNIEYINEIIQNKK